MIHVEFKGVPTNKFNGLAEFVKKLSENDSAFVEGSTSEREAGDSNTYHGFWNDGIVDQAYKPNHPTPGPEVEKYMKTRLLSYLHDNGIDASKVKLELVYGL